MLHRVTDSPNPTTAALRAELATKTAAWEAANGPVPVYGVTPSARLRSLREAQATIYEAKNRA